MTKTTLTKPKHRTIRSRAFASIALAVALGVAGPACAPAPTAVTPAPPERESPPEVGEDLLALYAKIRTSAGGVGAAELRQRRCGGCQLELNQVDLARIKAAPPDEVLRCEECRRVLVRTAESGL